MCNSRLIGGGRLIAPHAIVDDGWLDVCLIHAMPALEFVALLRRVSSGDHVDDDRVAYFRTQALDLVFDRAIRINTDGQVLEAERCRYDVLPGAARVLMPHTPRRLRSRPASSRALRGACYGAAIVHRFQPPLRWLW